MKVRFYPTKESIMDILTGVADRKKQALQDAVSRLNKAKESPMSANYDIHGLELEKEAFDRDLDETLQEIEVLESHEPPQVMVEMDI